MKTGGHIKRCNVGTVELHNERKQEYLDALAKESEEFKNKYGKRNV